MENKTQLAPEQPELENLERAKRNKKLFIYLASGIGAVAVILGVVFTVRHFSSQTQNENIGQADVTALVAAMSNDSTQNAKSMDMYKKIADDGSYDANERAQIYVAYDLYDKGKYEEALKYLDKVSPSSDIIECGVYTMKGDCYVNLKNYDEALENYDDAIDEADNNPMLVPYVLKKKANVYHEQKKYAEEYECYLTITRDFAGAIPEAEKYLQRAKVLANK